MRASAAGMSTTLLECAERQLRALADACAFSALETERAAILLRELTESWGTRSLHDVPRWSGVTDDCSPLEFSLGLTPDAAPELRFVLEAQHDPAAPQTYWTAAERLNERLERHHGACIERLRAIADLVRPTENVYFAMLHGVVLRPGRTPLFKVYLNPKAHGVQNASTVTAEAFERLGLREAWRSIASVLQPEDELQFIALDLTPESNARVKLYVRHRHSVLADFERAVSIAANDIAGDLAEFVTALVPSAASAGLSRPATTMYAATRDDARIDAAFSLATYPFIGSDAIAFERISNLLRRFGLPTTTYTRSVHGLATRTLSDEHGLHNYVSFQNRNGVRRVTVYLAPRMYLERFGPIGFDPVVAWPTPMGTATVPA